MYSLALEHSTCTKAISLRTVMGIRRSCMETNDEHIEITSAPDRIRISCVKQMLLKTYWCTGITDGEIRKGIDHSAIVVGAYLPDGTQVGFLRVVSDKVRFAYLLDVVVHEDYRRRGIGQKMVKYAMSHTELQDVYQWLLATRDARGVYEKCGFQKLDDPGKWMSKIKPRPDRTNYEG